MFEAAPPGLSAPNAGAEREPGERAGPPDVPGRHAAGRGGEGMHARRFPPLSLSACSAASPPPHALRPLPARRGLNYARRCGAARGLWTWKTRRSTTSFLLRWCGSSRRRLREGSRGRSACRGGRERVLAALRRGPRRQPLPQRLPAMRGGVRHIACLWLRGSCALLDHLAVRRGTGKRDAGADCRDRQRGWCRKERRAAVGSSSTDVFGLASWATVGRRWVGELTHCTPSHPVARCVRSRRRVSLSSTSRALLRAAC